MRKRNTLLVIVIALLISLIVVGCGSRPENNSAEDSGASATSGKSSIAAMPTANFKSVASQSGITTTIESSAASETEELDAAIALGERVYGNKCADCHGPTGEGSDKGAAIVGTALSFAEFEDLLRTGGELGPEHLFGTRAVSANGMAGLHAFLTASE